MEHSSSLYNSLIYHLALTFVLSMSLALSRIVPIVVRHSTRASSLLFTFSLIFSMNPIAFSVSKIHHESHDWINPLIDYACILSLIWKPRSYSWLIRTISFFKNTFLHFNINIFMSPDQMIRGILFLSCLSVWLPVVNFNLCNNFWTVRDKDFIFGMHTLLSNNIWCPFKWHQGEWPCDLDFDLCAKISFFFYFVVARA